MGVLPLLQTIEILSVTVRRLLQLEQFAHSSFCVVWPFFAGRACCVRVFFYITYNGLTTNSSVKVAHHGSRNDGVNSRNSGLWAFCCEPRETKDTNLKLINVTMLPSHLLLITRVIPKATCFPFPGKLIYSLDCVKIARIGTVTRIVTLRFTLYPNLMILWQCYWSVIACRFHPSGHQKSYECFAYFSALAFPVSEETALARGWQKRSWQETYPQHIQWVCTSYCAQVRKILRIFRWKESEIQAWLLHRELTATATRHLITLVMRSLRTPKSVKHLTLQMVGCVRGYQLISSFSSPLGSYYNVFKTYIFSLSVILLPVPTNFWPPLLQKHWRY